MNNSIVNFCKQLELYVQSDYYKSQIAIGAFSTRFDKFLLENETAKEHLFMLDVLIGEANERNELIECLEVISDSQYDGSAESYAERKLIELGIKNNEQDYLGRI